MEKENAIFPQFYTAELQQEGVFNNSYHPPHAYEIVKFTPFEVFIYGFVKIVLAYF